MTPQEKEEERDRQAAVVKRNRTVPYSDIERAVAIAQRQFPGTTVIGKMYGGAPYVEVWGENAGTVWFVDLDGGVCFRKGQSS